MLGAIEMLQRGITCVQDDAFLMPFPDPEIIDAVASAYRDSGIRAFLALDQPELTEAEKLPFVTELDAPPAACSTSRRRLPPPQLLEAYDHLIGHLARRRRRPDPGGRLDLRAATRQPGVLRRAGRSGRAPRPAVVRAHAGDQGPAHPDDRAAAVRRAVPGRYTAAAGLLKPHTNVIHAVWVDDADLDAIADAGSTVVHNPVSNLRLGSGVLPWRAMLDHDIPVALGTDEAICDDTINVWTVAKTAGLIHNVSGLDSDDWPTPLRFSTPCGGAVPAPPGGRRPRGGRARHARRSGAGRPARHRVHPTQRFTGAAGALRGRPRRGADHGGRTRGRRTRARHQRRRVGAARRGTGAVRREAARDPGCP